MRAPAPAVRRTAVVSDDDHAIAAWMSANVGRVDVEDDRKSRAR